MRYHYLVIYYATAADVIAGIEATGLNAVMMGNTIYPAAITQALSMGLKVAIQDSTCLLLGGVANPTYAAARAAVELRASQGAHEMIIGHEAGLMNVGATEWLTYVSAYVRKFGMEPTAICSDAANVAVCRAGNCRVWRQIFFGPFYGSDIPTQVAAAVADDPDALYAHVTGLKGYTDEAWRYPTLTENHLAEMLAELETQWPDGDVMWWKWDTSGFDSYDGLEEKAELSRLIKEAEAPEVPDPPVSEDVTPAILVLRRIVRWVVRLIRWIDSQMRKTENDAR